MLLVSRKINYKNLMKDYCLAIMCKLYQTNAGFTDDLISSEKSMAQPAENFDTAATIALIEIGKNTCIAMQKFLIMIMELVLSKKTAEMQGPTTRADGVRTPLLEIVLDELTHDKDILDSFLQLSTRIKWPKLAILGDAAFRSTMASESASSCYNAPETKYSKKATEQMDVYSFGVVLLELLRGRQAEQVLQSESLDIVKWVQRKVNITNGEVQVLDPKITSSAQQEMLVALEITLHCTSVMPEKRPSMSEAVKSL